jgi:hypothetical protein
VKQSVLLDPPDWGRPYGHLLPVVDVLVAGGNRVTRGGFHKDVDGWRCELVDPLDFELLRKRFRFPESICLAPGRDLVLCRRTWVAIEGGKARSNSEMDLAAHLYRDTGRLRILEAAQPELAYNDVDQLKGGAEPLGEAKPLLTVVQAKTADETEFPSVHQILEHASNWKSTRKGVLDELDRVKHARRRRRS